MSSMKSGEFEIRATADLQEGGELVHVQGYRLNQPVGPHYTVQSRLPGSNVPHYIVQCLMEAAMKGLKQPSDLA